MKNYSNGHVTIHDYFMMYFAKWKRVAVVLLAVWIVVTYLVISPLRCSGNSDEIPDVQERLKRMSSELEVLWQRNSKLIAQIKKSSGPNGNLKDLDPAFWNLEAGLGPSEEYENLRRRIHSNTKEFWYYANHELGKLMHESDKEAKIRAILEQLSDRKSTLLSDQEKLSEMDGYHEWRQLEAANVSDLVQRRLHYLQNPPDCREARKLICNLNKGCGFGCQLHHIVYCLIFAYATERTLILNSKGWRYNTKGWEYVFHPISESCLSSYDDKVVQWPVSYDAKVVSLPFIDSISQKPKFLPLAVPKDLAHRIVRFNGDPSSWWVGQMLKFVLKPRLPMQKAINDTIAKMNFKSPIVGVHIRRTDKVGTEAAFHHIHEYMAHVKDYYDQLELTRPVDVRRVYLATDDANVLDDARQKYPEYTFLGDPSIAKTAATHRRYTPLSLTGLLVDLHMLAMCDYLVCTFSSQVGRVAYEMMQSNRVDASNSFFSLDDIYYFGGQNAHDRVAIMQNHGGKNEDISFEVGDKIGVAGNHWNGYGRGTNKRTNMNGLIPWYKTADHLVLYPFPEYKQVPIYSETSQKNV
ncbi:alpha-(1,6)-fucosyltransferase-like isoform X1 [Bombyx mori]|uniref:Alpha 1,6-fucosyltransferase n=1 Tax=Bombyx mori TaxID=7091 RepID=A0A060PLD2_BOMMO|nr:alpha-(1,6)-fucosyltransferase-like [Bombyx mori]XP_012547444.1 alpha-(1,6)-fucosyltransferase-like isoform X1 [Bombyx mori]BAO96240.1 alpha 1,6-fucosyltransferase [Bombyx mori]